MHSGALLSIFPGGSLLEERGQVKGKVGAPGSVGLW